MAPLWQKSVCERVRATYAIYGHMNITLSGRALVETNGLNARALVPEDRSTDHAMVDHLIMGVIVPEGCAKLVLWSFLNVWIRLNWRQFCESRINHQI